LITPRLYQSSAACLPRRFEGVAFSDESAVATRRTRISRDSRGPSTWSRSAKSTTPTLGDRCRSRGLLVPCQSANVRVGRDLPAEEVPAAPAM